MKKFFLLLAAAVTIGGCQNNSYKPSSNPKKLVQQMVIPASPVWASHAFRVLHQDEIKKTLMVNETMEAGTLRAIFYSYSIGADVVRDVQWAAVINGNLYPVMEWGIEDDAEEYGATETEIKLIQQKANRWEEKPGRFWE